MRLLAMSRFTVGLAVGLAVGAVALWGCSGAGASAAAPGGPAPNGGVVVPDAGGHSTAALPCDVDQVLAGNCRQCHSSPPQFAAPMPLVTYADLQAPAKSDPTTPVYKMIGVRIHDDARPMPQPPNPRLNATDTAALDSWIAAGAPAATSANACAPGSDAGDGAASDGNVAPLSCTPDTHFSPQSAWSMPTDTDDVYVCYGIDVSLTSKRQVVGFAPRIDNHSIVHHVLLYQTASSMSSVPAPCSGGGVMGGRIIYGWAPGGEALELPAQVGFPEDPPTTHFVVQVHYNNINHLAGQTDATGFDLCTTDQLRPNDADVIAFGTETISIPAHAKLDQTCKFSIPAASPPLNAFMALPHMHQIGTTIATEDVTAAGTPVNLGNVPNWDFQNQVWQPITATLQPGDVIQTRCAWTNTSSSTVVFGPDTENEMCFSFTMYYPRVTVWNWSYPAVTSTCAPTQ
jgi:hypothetical protein